MQMAKEYSELQNKVVALTNKVMGNTYYTIKLILADGTTLSQPDNRCYLAPESIMGSIAMALHLPDVIEIQIKKSDERVFVDDRA